MGWRQWYPGVEVARRPTANPALQKRMNEGQLRWLLRRGMKELDVLTERYYARRWPEASADERARFIHLLQTTEDPDLWSWALGNAPPPDAYADVIEQLRRHH